MAERLGGVQVKGRGCRLIEKAFNNRKREGQCLPGSRGSGKDDVLSVTNGPDRLALVGLEGQPAIAKECLQRPGQGLW